MTLYRRTARGIQHLSSDAAPLPLKMKSLLRAVDGRTDVRAFQRQLSAFGDVAALFQALEAAGHIEPVPPHGGVERRSQARRSAPVSRAPSSEPLRAHADPGAGRPRVDPPTQARARNTSAAESSREAMRAAAAESRAEPTTLADAHRVRTAVDCMSHFVALHLPDQAFEVMLALDRLTTLDLLLRSLDGYQRLIASTGSTGRRHLQALQALLARP